MSIFKCKMCGGTIEFEQGATVGVCDSCGTKQTLPRLDDDRRANLYDRANHFRRNNDFDKAAAIYEQILNEDGTDAEAYWSLVLCRYGIEYIEDPATRKRVPTVNRAQFTSIFADEDYKSALQYADDYQKTIYEEEAKAIDEIQKGILEISSKEDPFDVFICYKETDANGRRTQDSVLANDLYHQLTQEGFKVFFSRITLEDKLGQEYEPYIFAALNSAKVMVVIGTKPEHFNAVWVKNEWSRYLALVKQSGGKKMLIPAYRDMDPYDLPDEFSHLQAQDMSKLGFMQDLIRGIKKIISADTPKATVKETVVVGAANANTAPLLERAFLFLEDGKWQDANSYCEKVLDIDPKNAEAYLGKLMADLQVKSRKQLADCDYPFDDKENYGKVLRFGDEKLEAEMRGYITHINERNENARLTGIYNGAVNAMNTANSEGAYKAAAEKFQTIPGYKDSDSLAEQCLEKAEVCRKDAIYTSAKSSMTGKKVKTYEAAIELFQTIPGWKDADELIDICRKKIEEIEANEEADRIEAKRKAEETAKKLKKVIAITVPIVCVCFAFLFVLEMVIIPNGKYKDAIALMESGNYEEAVSAFKTINGYKDSADKLKMIEGSDAWMRICPVGDTFFFGSYEQDNDTANGKEDIEWRVLAKEDHKILVISEYALDCKPYNTKEIRITWETCSLRKWLNETFLNTAFSGEEKSKILATTVTADENPNPKYHYTNQGNATKDKVFLLSITEAKKYFSSDSARKCAATEYAIAKGAHVYTGEVNCWWWLRTCGAEFRAADVEVDGEVSYFGDSVNDDDDGVRPAMWIKLGS